MRSFHGLPQASLRWLCDETALRPWSRSAFGAAWTKSLDDLLADEALDAVAFTGPQAAAHGRARAALEADKHVLVAGPLALSASEADELAELAEERGLRLWAHFPLVEHPAARRLHGLVEKQRLGEVFYLHATRFLSRDDPALDLLWGPGADVVALVLDLVADQPVEVAGRAESYLEPPRPDVVFAELRFATGIGARIHLSRLEGEIVDRLSLVASAATAVIDTGARGHELALHEPETTTAYPLPAEDLTLAACARFVGAIRSPGETHQGREAAATVSVLESLERSCVSGGAAGAVVARERPDRNVLAFRR